MMFNDVSFTCVHGNSNTFNGDVYNLQNAKTNGPEIGLLELLRASAPGAAFDSEERHPPPKCHPGTRVDILEQINQWIDASYASSGTRIAWLHGPAGAGKSAIAQTIAETCATEKQLAASFFFWKASPSRNNARAFFTTIALQLALAMPDKRKGICEAVEKDTLLVQKRHADQLKQLIIDPISSPSSPDTPKATSSPLLVVVDGLDECGSSRDQVELLSHIVALTTRAPLRFLIVSRPEHNIQTFFDKRIPRDVSVISLYGGFRAREDVRKFLKDSFHELCMSGRHDEILNSVLKPWPSNEDVQLLAERSDGYFIYASTALKYIDDEYTSCVERLEEVLNTSRMGSAAFKELDKLYLHILSKCPDTEHLMRILGGGLIPTPRLVWTYGLPYTQRSTGLGTEAPSHKTCETIETIEMVLDLRPGKVMLILRVLRSVLQFRVNENGERTVIPFHASFMDFVLDKSRAGRYYLDEMASHATMVRGAADLIRRWDIRFEPGVDLVQLGPTGDAKLFWFTSDPKSITVSRVYFAIRILFEHLMVATLYQESLLVDTRQSIEHWNPWFSAAVPTANLATHPQWPTASQVLLLHSLSHSIRLLDKLRCLREESQAPVLKDLINQFSGLLESGFQSIAGFPAITHTILILPSPCFPDIDVCKPFASVIEQLLKRSGFGLPVDVNAHIYLLAFINRWHTRSGGPIYDLSEEGRALREFLIDRKRCGELYSDELERYTCITNAWLLQLTDQSKGPPQNDDELWAHNVILRNWSKFLVLSAPGNENLVSRLRDFDLRMACKVDADRVIQWLESSENPPRDVLFHWTPCQIRDSLLLRTLEHSRRSDKMTQAVTKVERCVERMRNRSTGVKAKSGPALDGAEIFRASSTILRLERTPGEVTLLVERRYML